MTEKSNIVIVSHNDAGNLVIALELVRKLDPSISIDEIARNKALNIQHSLGEAALSALCEKLDNMRLDYSLSAPSPKKLLIADMDSTIISCECLDELADFAGVKTEVAAITERAMAGEIDFENALVERVKMLKGLSKSALEACFEERVNLNKGAIEMIARLKENDIYCALVSGGFKFFTSRVAKAAGFDEENANDFVFSNDQLTGKVKMPILGKEAKLARLNHLCTHLNIELHDTIAIGDGANDLMMIEAAGLGIAYMAKPIVAARAKARINSGNLESVPLFCGIV